jgi:hypothetical protein
VAPHNCRPGRHIAAPQCRVSCSRRKDGCVDPPKRMDYLATLLFLLLFLYLSWLRDARYDLCSTLETIHHNNLALQELATSVWQKLGLQSTALKSNHIFTSKNLLNRYNLTLDQNMLSLRAHRQLS